MNIYATLITLQLKYATQSSSTILKTTVRSPLT